MVIKLFAGTLSILAFSIALFAGVWAGNEFTTILIRAWSAMILFLIIGAVIGWFAQIVLDEHNRQKAEKEIEQANNQSAQEQSEPINNSELPLTEE